ALRQGHARLEPALRGGLLDDGDAVTVGLDGDVAVAVTLALAQPGVELGREHGIPLVREGGAPLLDVAADAEDLLQDHEPGGPAVAPREPEQPGQRTVRGGDLVGGRGAHRRSPSGSIMLVTTPTAEMINEPSTA